MMLIKWQKHLNSVVVLDTHRMFIPRCTDTNLGYTFNFSSKIDILHYNKIYSVIYRCCCCCRRYNYVSFSLWNRKFWLIIDKTNSIFDTQYLRLHLYQGFYVKCAFLCYDKRTYIYTLRRRYICLALVSILKLHWFQERIEIGYSKYNFCFCYVMSRVSFFEKQSFNIGIKTKFC